jgi:alpha-galactosidase
MASPKVVLIGAGSLFFARQAIVGMTRVPSLAGGELCLVDVDEERLGIVERVARRVVESTGEATTIRATLHRREVLPDADFVILAFANRGVYFRALDCRIANEHGIRMCSGDTVGPGGIFRTLRTVPVVLEIAEDIQDLCPDAWVINYTNPTATVGIALNRYTPLKAIALCNSQETPQLLKKRIVERLDLVGAGEEVSQDTLDSIQIKAGGINHFTWMTELVRDGKDLFPVLREHLAARVEEGDSERLPVLLQLFDAFGAMPTVLAHTIEYVPFFQGKGSSPDSYVAEIWNEERRRKWLAAFWDEMGAYADGRRGIGQLIQETPTDMCINIIDALLSDSQEVFYVNVPNQGTITNLPDDAIVEIAASVGRDGCQLLPFGDLPRALLGLTGPVLQAHELAVEAAVSGSRSALLRALLVDPLVLSIEDACSLIERTLEAERDALPETWYQ